MSSKKIVPEPEILKQIAEEEVCQWMAAKLHEIRTKIPAHCMDISVHFRKWGVENEIYTCWGMHAADKCVVSEESTDTAIAKLVNELNNNPAQRAAEARRKARRLMEEADQIESTIARSVETIKEPTSA